MALLQISEPGLTASPHQRRFAAGIDLGTTNSLIATVRSGLAETLADDQGQHLLPSVVHYSDIITVGHQARNNASHDPLNTISSAKRLLGRSLADINQRYPDLPYQLQANDHGLPVINTSCGAVNPIQVSAQILRSLAQRATTTLGAELDGVVITVPAYFDDAQRQATKDAATLAGLTVLRLLNEPTAAALAYGLDSGQEGIIVVYDLGGGTFDISVLRLNKGVFEVLATGGDTALGGDDFDQQIVQWIAQQAKMNYQQDPHLYRRLLDKAIAAKIALSTQPEVTINLDNWQGVLTRIAFEQMITPIVKRTLFTCRRALKDAGITHNEVMQVVMVGGSTRVPLVQKQITQFFERSPLTDIDPERVVAIGAALQADILIGNKPDNEMLLLDVTPLSLGLETMGGLVEKIIPRNTTIPVARAQEFTTFKEGQRAMMIHVLQGERDLVQDCRSLARFTLQGLPPLAAGAAHIRVTFQIDADGLLSVTALEKSTNVQASVQIKPSYGLEEKAIAAMLKESLTFAQEDKVARYLAEQRLEAERLLESLSSALRMDAKLLNATEHQLIDQQIAQLQQYVLEDDAKAIEDAIKQLDQLTQAFAARRMDHTIRNALTGHAVDEI